MTLKKKTFSEEEILIYDEAVIYKRGDIWQFRYWLEKERRYVRLSLKTKNQVSAIETAKKHFVKIKSETDSGKTYYSKTTKDGVLLYLEYRKGHIDSRTTKSIVKGRYGTIRAHLEHWLDFIERDTKLKELDRYSCAPTRVDTVIVDIFNVEVAQEEINSVDPNNVEKNIVDVLTFDAVSVLPNNVE